MKKNKINNMFDIYFNPEPVMYATTTTSDQELDAMICDFTAVGSRPKSEVHRRIKAYAAAAHKRGVEEEHARIKSIIKEMRVQKEPRVPEALHTPWSEGYDAAISDLLTQLGKKV